jgi:competence protein ComEC
VVRLQYGKHSFLFTGDIEEAAEREILKNSGPFHVTLLKVPHHGSRSSIDPGFLSRLCPTIAVVSSGRANPYGHPASETLEAYRLLGTHLYRTDLDGAVFVKTDGDRLSLFTREDFALRPIRWEGGMGAAELGNWRVVFRRWMAIDPS